MPKSPPTAHIRVRVASSSSYWKWQLVTGDGHVAAASSPFGTYEACVEDALKQEIPVVGLKKWKRRQKAAHVDPEETPRSHWTFPYDDSSGFWQWQRTNERREVVEESDRAFLTKAECVADAQKHGYSPRQSHEEPHNT